MKVYTTLTGSSGGLAQSVVRMAVKQALEKPSVGGDYPVEIIAGNRVEARRNWFAHSVQREEWMCGQSAAANALPFALRGRCGAFSPLERGVRDFGSIRGKAFPQKLLISPRKQKNALSK